MDHSERILIVDDDKGVRDAYRAILAPPNSAGKGMGTLLRQGGRLFGRAEPTPRDGTTGWEIVEAKNGDLAVAEVQEAAGRNEPFALVFLDMKMPGMDGAETAQALWKIDPALKIVIVTAFSDVSPDEIVEAVNREDLFYLRKPFNPHEIKQFARALCRQRRLELARDRLAAELHDANSALADMNRNLREKVRRQTEMLIQSEKMASLGILAAGVGHEINNPLAFIKGNLWSLGEYMSDISALMGEYESLETLAGAGRAREVKEKIRRIAQFKKSRRMDDIFRDLPALISQSVDGTERIGNIVKDLRGFSRVDEKDGSPVDVNDCLDTAAGILDNRMKEGVTLVRDYVKDLPPVKGFPQKLNQAFVNLLMNACQAVEEHGTIHMATRLERPSREEAGTYVSVEISDTGPGMARETLSQVFDPFFTTKPVGEGVGLGLYITYEIVQIHRGAISVESRPGEGTRFTVRLPV